MKSGLDREHSSHWESDDAVDIKQQLMVEFSTCQTVSVVARFYRAWEFSVLILGFNQRYFLVWNQINRDFQPLPLSLCDCVIVFVPLMALGDRTHFHVYLMTFCAKLCQLHTISHSVKTLQVRVSPLNHHQCVYLHCYLRRTRQI